MHEREEQRRSKYQELATDLAVQNAGWRVSVLPVVIENLASMGKLRDELTSTELFTRHQVNCHAQEVQYEALCPSIHIIRRVMTQNEE